MKSIAWPNIFSPSKSPTNLVEGKEALYMNLKLLLNTHLNSLYGDPGYGNKLISLLFNPNNTILADLVIDEICSIVNLYIPQLYVDRGAVTFTTTQTTLTAHIQVQHLIDRTSDMFSINLIDNLEEA